jgi:hypothetical protein
MSKLLSELLDLPEQVRQGDFVLNLSTGVTQPQKTLEQYVVTPQLAECFDNALKLVKAAVGTGSNKATYLHGSFGAGKSHFMAVLHLLLQHNADVRKVKELTKVCADHEWVEKKRFLLVPFNMTNAKDMETAILGGYVKYVSELHPDAPLPGVFLAEEIFANAKQLRIDLGDEKFFAKLNQGKTEHGPGNSTRRFGKMKHAKVAASGWDAGSFEEALEAAPGSNERSLLVGDLVKTIFPAFRGIAHGKDEAYVDLETGMSVLSNHAESLGYDALILFLDELILWLSTNSGNLDFVQKEANKLVKLVDSKKSACPIPIISFVARQRDLRELIGDRISGIEQVNLSQILSHMEGRFDMVTLEDRNLPVIAQKRVLKPKNDASREELKEAFEQASKLQPEVMQILLARDGDRALFQQVYPFSPALIKALVAISSALQRERTALKIMLELLVMRRDTLMVGDIIPLGDLWDVVADGGDTFNDVLKIRFNNAKKLYKGKLLPMLEEQHSVDLEVDRKRAASDEAVAKKLQNFENDNRLIKSLLLSALVEGEETLKSMTCDRLAALNHGSVKSRFSGREYQTVKNKFTDWSGLHGEIHLSGDATNPVISLQLVGVDTDQIIQAARAYDRPGERQLKIRRMLLSSFEMQEQESVFFTHQFEWRGTKRFCDVLFDNVRRTTDESLRSNGDEWKLVIDFPFDPEGKSPIEDIDRVNRFKERKESPKTLVWLPAFFSAKTQGELGQLVIIDHLLRGNNLDQHASTLSLQDRETARTILQSRQSALTSKIQATVEAAYGIRKEAHPGSLDTSFDITDSQFMSLYPSLVLQRPVGSTLNEAMMHLLDQALKHQYPKHPMFGQEVKVGKDMKDVLATCQEAAHTQDGRLYVEDGRLRKTLKNICDPLELGSMGETHFVLESYWKTLFNKSLSASGKQNPDVNDMRQWIDQPEPRGLPKEIQNLLIIVYAEQTNRSFIKYGATEIPKLDDLSNEWELREEVLPSEVDWQETRKRMAEVFGDDIPKLLNTSNLAGLAKKFTSDGVNVKEEDKGYLAKFKSNCDMLPDRLSFVLSKLGVPEDEVRKCDRMKTAQAARGLLAACDGLEPTPLVAAIAKAKIETSSKSLARSIKSVDKVLASLRSPNRWELFEAVAQISDKRKTDATLLLDDLRTWLKMDEFALVGGLSDKLLEAEGRAIQLLKPPTIAPPGPGPEPDPEPMPGWKRIATGSKSRLTSKDLSATTNELLTKLDSNPKCRVSLNWTIEEEESR